MRNKMIIKELLEIIDNEYLIESPMRISALIISELQDPRKNKKLYKTILQQKIKTCIEIYNTEVELWKITRGKETEIYALIPSKQKVGYYVRWELQNANFFDVDWSTQVLVWAGTNPETKGLPEHVFFNYIIPETGAVVSDIKQTERGELFWKRMIAEAFKKQKYKIYLIDFNNERTVRIKSEDDYDKLINSPNDPWGSKAIHKGLHIAISDFDFIQE